MTIYTVEDKGLLQLVCLLISRELQYLEDCSVPVTSARLKTDSLANEGPALSDTRFSSTWAIQLSEAERFTLQVYVFGVLLDTATGTKKC